MILELIHKITHKRYKGTDLYYKLSDKYGYLLLDDKLVETYHPVYSEQEFHDLVDLDYQKIYHKSVVKKGGK